MTTSTDLLHFKPELTPNYWKSHQSDNSCWSVSYCSISSLNLSFIPPKIFLRKSTLKSCIQLSQYDRCQTQQAEEFEACGQFKCTNQRLASCETPPRFKIPFLPAQEFWHFCSFKWQSLLANQLDRFFDLSLCFDLSNACAVCRLAWGAVLSSHASNLIL